MVFIFVTLFLNFLNNILFGKFFSNKKPVLNNLVVFNYIKFQLIDQFANFPNSLLLLKTKNLTDYYYTKEWMPTFLLYSK